VKLGLLAGIFTMAYAVETPEAILPVLAVVASLIFAAGATENIWRLRWFFVAIPAGSFLVWALFYGRGEPLPALAPLGVSAEGLRYAAGTALRLETYLAVSVLFLSMTRVEEFTASLRSLGVPYRLCFAIALSFRLVPLFLSSAFTVVAAQRARGLELSRGGLVARLRRYVPVLVPVFMGALRRADALAIALEARGFGREGPRTLYPRGRFRALDWAVAVTLAAGVAAYLWAWRRGYGRISG
jgi:energy-coupling factor transporter transmembrane protein EcfT